MYCLEINFLLGLFCLNDFDLLPAFSANLKLTVQSTDKHLIELLKT